MAERDAGYIFATVVPPGGMLTSPEDKRLYRRVELPNGLVAILVHDPFMAARGLAVSWAAPCFPEGCFITPSLTCAPPGRR